MRIIEVRPTPKFGGAWLSFEREGVEPAFVEPNGKRKAIDYAKQRFGGSKGEVHVYDESGLTIGDKIAIDGHGQYCQAES